MASLSLPQKENFNNQPGEAPTTLWTLQNRHISCQITNYGARVVSLVVHDKTGSPVDVALGFPSLGQYKSASDPYYGAILGRYANRIANGQFELDGVRYSLQHNNGPNTIHGGKRGFHSQVWKIDNADDGRLQLSYLSPDGDEGFPGNLHATVAYELVRSGIKIFYRATTSAPKTIVNMSNHTYLNLNGAGNGDVMGHLLCIAASHYTPTNELQIPIGTVSEVKNTPFDFRLPRAISFRIEEPDQQLLFAKGYDQNFVLDHVPGAPDLVIIGDQSRIRMRLYTTEPAIQFYSGNHMSGADVGKEGKLYGTRHGFSAEPQHFPDSPNNPLFPSVTLTPEVDFVSESLYLFDIG